jgi:hypothetical protein
MNYRPTLERVGPPPAPGTVPSIQYAPLAGAMGETDAYGNIVIDSGLDADEAQITLNHELVHRFFSPKFGPFLQLRARVAISGYVRSAMLRYLEEALAEGYAQIRAEGSKGVIEGIRFSLKGRNPYISISERDQVGGQFFGVIVVTRNADDRHPPAWPCTDRVCPVGQASHSAHSISGACTSMSFREDRSRSLRFLPV